MDLWNCQIRSSLIHLEEEFSTQGTVSAQGIAKHGDVIIVTSA